jgi:hypothetical protein
MLTDHLLEDSSALLRGRMKRELEDIRADLHADQPLPRGFLGTLTRYNEEGARGH